MGGAVSSGRNNDDLIDNLLEADYIKTSLIERVFRAVDRAEYFLPESRGNAYKDLAWKSGHLHISAPCIYSEVMEGLNLLPGASFLNMGSGTGYLSTMVGLILGTNGLNHGIEIHEDVIEYANKKLEDFKRYSGAMDEYDFCEPKFVQGNCLCLTSESTAFYDRIYCGAACPERFESYMKNFLKIGGILVMPTNDQLLQITRLSETMWKVKTLLPVSFASLVVPADGFQEFIKPIEVEPLSLQILCRTVVRNILRKNVEKEHPPVKRSLPTKAPKKKRALKRLVVPLFDDDDSSEDERRVRLGGERNRDAGRAVFRREDDEIFSFFLGMGNRRGSGAERDSSSSNSRGREPSRNQEVMETDSNAADDSDASKSGSHQVRAVIEHHPDAENNEDSNESYRNREQQCMEVMNEISDVLVDCLDMLRRDRENLDSQEENLSNENNENEENEHENNTEEKQEDSTNQNSDIEINQLTSRPSTSTTTTKKNGRREKFDSGLGDEIVEAQDSSDEDDRMKLDAISSCDEDYTSEKRQKRDSSSDSEEELKEADNEMRMYVSPYTEHMVAKIQQLPLPQLLKRYLNYYRELNKEE